MEPCLDERVPQITSDVLGEAVPFRHPSLLERSHGRVTGNGTHRSCRASRFPAPLGD